MVKKINVLFDCAFLSHVYSFKHIRIFFVQIFPPIWGITYGVRLIQRRTGSINAQQEIASHRLNTNTVI